MKTTFKTDRGKVRSHNEDSGAVFIHPDKNIVIAVVADGMGGHQAGDVASKMAVDEITRKWSAVDSFDSPDMAEKWLEETVQEINKLILNYANEHVECKGMGTTIVMSICTSEFLSVAHIGDSRCYLYNNHSFSQLTEDHSLVNELVRSGQISKEDALNHPRKNVLMRALGTEENVSVDIKTIEWEINDQLILCSDGLTNKLSDVEIKEVLEKQIHVDEKADYLIKRANELGGEDNITVALVEFLQDETEGE